mmetsp:Transcript_68064/g.162525  ORF Transcript_68064/g.162525 Transcript_68064/m.162525 type:complete len:264 (+) Transcript_68064:177-968(+)
MRPDPVRVPQVLRDKPGPRAADPPREPEASPALHPRPPQKQGADGRCSDRQNRRARPPHPTPPHPLCLRDRIVRVPANVPAAQPRREPRILQPARPGGDAADDQSLGREARPGRRLPDGQLGDDVPVAGRILPALLRRTALRRPNAPRKSGAAPTAGVPRQRPLPARHGDRRTAPTRPRLLLHRPGDAAEGPGRGEPLRIPRRGPRRHGCELRRLPLPRPWPDPGQARLVHWSHSTAPTSAAFSQLLFLLPARADTAPRRAPA